MVHLQCQGHADCATAKSWFYVRAYGPAVITGLVTPVATAKGGLYQVRFRPLDPGTYHVEVVLAFSKPPAVEEFPLAAHYPPVNYEGYLLPGFPMQLTVTESTSGTTAETIPNSDLPFCQVQQLYENSTTTAMEQARWLVTDKNHQKLHHMRTSKPDSVGLENYQKTSNSLGVTMDYVFKDCQLLPLLRKYDPFQCVADKLLSNQTVHLIFIGDSTMAMQRTAFEKIIQRTKKLGRQVQGVILHSTWWRLQVFARDKSQREGGQCDCRATDPGVRSQRAPDCNVQYGLARYSSPLQRGSGI